MRKLAPLSAIALGREDIAVLALGQQAQDRTALCSVFTQTNWKLYEAGTRRKGLELLRLHGIRVVICETELPDGDWKTVLEVLRDLPTHPRLIVSSHVTDQRLWGEVLNLDAYDLLATPFDPSEVRRMVVLAWQASKRDVQPASRVHLLTGGIHAAAAQA